MELKIIRRLSALTVFIVSISCSFCAHSQEYSKEFPHWSDLDRDGRDTKDELFATRVLMFSWVCPYTGEVSSDPNKLDADYIVPLRWAWQHGADSWTTKQRELFANDPENLALVIKPIILSKNGQAIDEWLPPNAYHHQWYIQQFKKVCKKYGLPEIKAMNEK